MGPTRAIFTVYLVVIVTAIAYALYVGLIGQ